jgi:hypothetical protein
MHIGPLRADDEQRTLELIADGWEPIHGLEEEDA